MSKLLVFDRNALPEPEAGAPSAERIISGDPQHLTWNLETSEDETVFSGLWQSTPGAWRISYDEWEFCTLLEGVSILHEEGGPSVTLTAGSQFVIRLGFTGIWEVVETTLKTYVIRVKVPSPRMRGEGWGEGQFWYIPVGPTTYCLLSGHACGLSTFSPYTGRRKHFIPKTPRFRGYD